jgi:hypothetical protein
VEEEEECEEEQKERRMTKSDQLSAERCVTSIEELDKLRRKGENKVI